MIIELLFTNPLYFFIVIIALGLAFIIHEYSHAQAADFLGDSTPKYAGRLTLNPLSHLDPFGTLFLIFFGFGWGKPVPFNPQNLKNPKRDTILIAIAGPVSNISMAVVVGVFLRIFKINSPFLIYFVWINLLLGTFNLIPVFPLDGSYLLNLFSSFENFKFIFFQYYPFFLLFAVFFMNYFLIPFLCTPLFRLITGFSLF